MAATTMTATMFGDAGVGRFWREMSREEWERGFFNELGRVLVAESGTIPENVWKQISTLEETRKIWITAFTHFSVDFQDNYEYYETFGDALLDSALKYLIYTNAGVWQSLQKTTGVEGRISNIAQHYASKPWMRSAFQNKFGDLYKYIRCSEMYKNQRDLMEDCMESMIFAIQNSLDRVTWKGQYKGPGFPAVNKFVEWLYQDEVGKFSTTQKVASQFLKEIIESDSFRYTEVTKDLQLKYPRAYSRIPDPENTFFKAYGPKEGARGNPFDKLSNFASELLFVRYIQEDRVTVFYFTMESYMQYKQEFRTIDKKMASSEFVKIIIRYMELAHPSQVNEKRNADISGVVTVEKQKKEFSQYGFNEQDYEYILRNLPANVIRETVQIYEDTNFYGKIFILWGVNQISNTKQQLFSVEIPNDKLKDRNQLIAKAASAVFSGYNFFSMGEAEEDIF